ncbi:DUF806 family protein [uncultured Weissella sp.]|uniref:DUF806 family protein n=1 Tax=uncultured Weissella sp. TaxID=253243 RepID=UPI002585EBB4|nr:DUF806 family protein [uncultured Weissella sp.]
MTVVMDTYKLIKQHVTWADGIYPKSIPKEAPVNKTSLLIRDAYSDLGSFGNDTFNSIAQSVVIQIYYSINSELDYDQVEIELMKLLMANHYMITDIKGRQTDPDTAQDFQTIQITKDTGIKEAQ